MLLKNYSNFINETKRKRPWIYKKTKNVGKWHVLNGRYKEEQPDIVMGDFSVHDAELTTLEGSPKKVEGNFYSSVNDFTNLIGGPEYVGGDYHCRENYKLTSLEGVAKHIGGKFVCNDNNRIIVEVKFVQSGSYKNNYWEDLLMYMIKEKIDLKHVKGWPEGFLDKELGKSAKSIKKFNL
jgi:hypothetical protein